MRTVGFNKDVLFKYVLTTDSNIRNVKSSEDCACILPVNKTVNR
jgi:hypothetical protein